MSDRKKTVALLKAASERCQKAAATFQEDSDRYTETTKDFNELQSMFRALSTTNIDKPEVLIKICDTQTSALAESSMAMRAIASRFNAVVNKHRQLLREAGLLLSEEG